MSNSFIIKIILASLILNTNYASVSSTHKEHNLSSTSLKKQISRSFVNSAPEITASGNQAIVQEMINIVTDVNIADQTTAVQMLSIFKFLQVIFGKTI
jgi:type III secretion system FlhB-like substrate exporter